MAPLEMSRWIYWRGKRPVLLAYRLGGYVIRVEVLGRGRRAVPAARLTPAEARELVGGARRAVPRISTWVLAWNRGAAVRTSHTSACAPRLPR